MPAAGICPPRARPLPGVRAAASAVRRLTADPRHFQIVALATLLGHGLLSLDFALVPSQLATTVATALGVQWLATRLVSGGRAELRSALVSALSLCILLRVSDPALAALAAALAIGSKFCLRVRGAHVFNPTAIAIALLVTAFDGAWVSPGQWGSTALAGLLFAGLGLTVLTRARRLDTLLAFLGAWSAALLARAAWYGDPLAVAVHQLANGALLLFAFFMITDPRTTPGTRAGRILFACAVAAVGAALGFGLHRPDALILALAACGPLSPLIDAALASRRARRHSPSTPSRS